MPLFHLYHQNFLNHIAVSLAFSGSPHSLSITCCIARFIRYLRSITTDPVRFRVALLAADPPDNAITACLSMKRS
ncbi:hypothetical protein DXM21_13430 [Agrobacterium rosae]|nr:hypothetical protein DXM21_13430 [Agrobacterium rosae]KAA3519113.1 hypothetical protein DXM25_14595 [Agrobacterium rosae]MQB49139.1 hypothetical protein [Agrobacterium rosae]